MTTDVDLSLGVDLEDAANETYGDLEDFVDDAVERGGGVPSRIVGPPADMSRIFHGVTTHTSQGGEVFDAMTVEGDDATVEVLKKIQSRYGDGQTNSNPQLKKNDMRRIMRVPTHNGVVPHLLKFGPDHFDVYNYHEDDVKRIMKSDTMVARAVRMGKY